MDLHIGATFERPFKALTDAHFFLFSGITGDTHPIDYGIEYAKQTRFGKPLAQGCVDRDLRHGSAAEQPGSMP